MKTGKRIFKILILCLCCVAIAIAIFLLGKITKKIERKQWEERMKEYTADYGSENGLYSQTEETAIRVFKDCNDAVVNVSGVGSGFFVSQDGYICTNAHVTEGLDSITVITSDGMEYSAVLIGEDEENDIAVLKVDAGKKVKFPYLEFSSSDNLQVGQNVYAIGNPYGFDRTLTTGIVSGLSRPVRSEQGKVLLGMIQTSAQIYPGNSGGPLLNSFGKVIGICSAVSNDIGFAVSSDEAENSLNDIVKYGKVTRGWLDIVPVSLSAQIVEYASLKVDKGVLVSQVITGGKAEDAGIKGGNKQVLYGNKSVIYIGGDVITKINYTDISDISDLFSALSSTRPGDKAEVTVNRNGNSVKLKVVLVERTSELVSHISR